MPSESSLKLAKKTMKTKTVNNTTEKHRKIKHKEGYTIYIYKLLKEVHPDLGISRRAMSIMNCFVQDVFEKVADECTHLVQNNKRSTISSWDIQTAVRLLIPGELAKHAVSEGIKAVTKYNYYPRVKKTRNFSEDSLSLNFCREIKKENLVPFKLTIIEEN
ncbi:hypothetical protein Ahia01_000849500 [Argonauta hians]